MRERLVLVRAVLARAGLAMSMLVLAACAAGPHEPTVASEDFCSDPRIVVEMQRQDPKLLPMGMPWCEATNVAFRRDGETIEIPVAKVLRGYQSSYDVLWGVADTIIRLPDDRLVNLGPNSAVPIRNTGTVERHVADVLGMGPVRPSHQRFDRFYAAILELTKRGYCVSYDMKPPFAGQLSECTTLSGLYGEVSYLPGATTWEQAKAIACGQIDRSAAPCPINDMSLAADAQGHALYVIEFWLDDRYLYYTVDAMTGSPRRRWASPSSIPVDQLLSAH
jgi:hypothetical protein